MGRYNLTRLFKEMNMVVRKFKARDLSEIANSVSPFTVGFDRVFDNLNTVAELSNNYPPYNIIDNDSGKYTIEFAAAGFTNEELSLVQVPEGNKLVVQGMQGKSDERKFLHQGIGARNFTKTFALNQDVQVTGAEFVQGMLKIYLEHIVPEERKPREIKINEIGDDDKQFLQD
jgi:molecular chaperone IbpA